MKSFHSILQGPRRVAVIGAGAAGLTAAKALCEVGIEPVVYEASGNSGGLWIYQHDGDGPAYRSLRTNTSKQVTAFSDFPFDDDLPDFPSRDAVERYLYEYARSFQMLPMIRRRHRVTAVEPADQGRWRLDVQVDGRTDTPVFDAVLVCAGIFRQPAMPAIPGMEYYRGHMLHSMAYRTAEPFAGRRVLVVGLGSSASDIAVDLLSCARQVTLSTRRGASIGPRTIDGRPRDHLNSRLSLLVPTAWRSWYQSRLMKHEYERRGWPRLEDLWARFGVPFDPSAAPSVTSDELLPSILSGRICVRPGISCFSHDGVVFADGSRAQADTIIFGTGYSLNFPFLPPTLRPWVNGGEGLYRLVFPPDYPTLAFIGVCRAQGPIFPIVEMQARWSAQVLAGQVGLPDRATMRAEIRARLQSPSAGQDSIIRVQLIPYLDELGELIGVRPRLSRHPDLLWPLLAGPPVAAQYRLNGPHAWAGAGDVIRAAMRR